MGRQVRQTNAAGRPVRYAYHRLGGLEAQWGDATYPMRLEYDSVYGHVIQQKTYRSAPAADSTDMTGVGPEDIVTFDVDPASGLLTERRDPSGNPVTYT